MEVNIPPIGVTHVCDFLESPRHYYYKRILKKRDETPAMREGIQFHMLMLEPEKFYATYFTDITPPAGVQVLKTVDDLKTFLIAMGQKPQGKKEELISLASAFVNPASEIIYDHWFTDMTDGKEFIPLTKWTMLHEMRDSLLEHKFTKRYLQFGKKEMFVEGQIAGFHIRGRLDWLVDDPSLPYVIVIDLKKTASAKFFAFRSQILNGWYFVQAALYAKLIEAKYNKPVLYVWMACEPNGPKICEAYSANEATLEAGDKAANYALARMKQCFETNEWPAYTDGMVSNIDLPAHGYDRVAEMDLEVEEHDDTPSGI